MKNADAFKNKISILCTDIDDTMTDEGQLHPEAYQSVWDLADCGVRVVPITGRPAGYCEMIARYWPVAGVIGENGAFYFRYHQKKMHRFFLQTEKERLAHQKKLKKIQIEILKKIPGCAVSSDQFCRLFDLAIDFCEDVKPLSATEIKKIVSIFEKHHAQAKVSSIHINGWFGDFNKLTTTLTFLKKEMKLKTAEFKNQVAFIGDSPNDEPMWKYFRNTFAVANFKNFEKQIQHKPRFITTGSGGLGFRELSKIIIKNNLC